MSRRRLPNFGVRPSARAAGRGTTLLLVAALAALSAAACATVAPPVEAPAAVVAAPAHGVSPAVVIAATDSAAPAEGVVAPADSAAPAPICYDCFWQYQPAGFREELAAWYEAHPSPDALLDADRRYLLARVRADREAMCGAREAFAAARDTLRHPARRMMADEALAFTAAECGADPGAWFARAARSADAARQPFKADVYRRIADGTFRPRIGEVAVARRLEVPDGVTAYVLGASAIRVPAGRRIGVQMERTVRDWLSYQLAWDFTERPPGREQLIPWHEGSRLADILAAAPVEIVPLPGVLAVRDGDRWLAADDQGVFRFEVLIDKIQYPTTRVHGDVALLVDTHGISSLVEPAVRRGAQLVVGCCDTPFKAQGAWWLASLGVDVYYPCDRAADELLGYEGKGTLIGSAPVRSEGGVAVIGDRPVRFSVWETIVVEDTDVDGGNQYYDAPARYFRRLSESLPLRLEVVKVTGPDQSARVVDRAIQLGAEAIAVRARTDEDARSVRLWLSASPKRRAVLFHTAPYPAGYALFQEFPQQTTFGDARPRFLVEDTSARREP
jgi:hypothetical protein